MLLLLTAMPRAKIISLCNTRTVIGSWFYFHDHQTMVQMPTSPMQLLITGSHTITPLWFPAGQLRPPFHHDFMTNVVRCEENSLQKLLYLIFLDLFQKWGEKKLSIKFLFFFFVFLDGNSQIQFGNIYNKKKNWTWK